MNLDPIIWWTGATLLCAGAALAAAVVFAALVGGTIALVSFYGQRASNLVSNIHFMHEWRRAG